MDYCIRVHHNGVVYETFARDYISAVVSFEAHSKFYPDTSLWKGSEKLR